MTVYELCERIAVNTVTGQSLGRVDDLTFDPQSACITGIVIYGRLKFFGLLGREEDTVIPWQEIEKVGADVVLVRSGSVNAQKKKWFAIKP